MKYIKTFDLASEYEAYMSGEPVLPNVSYVIESDNVFYTIVPTGTMYTVLLVEQSDISGLTYNMVDLGLSVKWADMNVGANSSEDYGCYFQWGDTVGYKYKGAQQVSAGELATLMQPNLFPDPSADDYVELTEDNIGDILASSGFEGTDLSTMGSGFVKNKSFDWDSYFDNPSGDGSTFIKYNNDGGLTTLEAADDAATVHMGGSWRMPTQAEIEELYNGTTPTFIDMDGNEVSSTYEGNLKGVRLTSNTNGNSIFIPVAGYCNDSDLYSVGSHGSLWSSSLRTSNLNSSSSAHGLSLDYDGYLNKSFSNRRSGKSVRGVCE